MLNAKTGRPQRREILFSIHISADTIAQLRDTYAANELKVRNTAARLTRNGCLPTNKFANAPVTIAGARRTGRRYVSQNPKRPAAKLTAATVRLQRKIPKMSRDTTESSTSRSPFPKTDGDSLDTVQPVAVACASA